MSLLHFILGVAGIFIVLIAPMIGVFIVLAIHDVIEERRKNKTWGERNE